MNHIQNLPFFKVKNNKTYEELSVSLAMSLLNTAKVDQTNWHDRIINNTNYENSVSDKVITPAQALQGLVNLESLKEALVKYSQRTNNVAKLPENIKTIPTFFEAAVEETELSDSAKETFANISERARREFIEEKIARADQYNIPYDVLNVNFLELSYKIDEYEKLLNKAQEHNIDWDISEYDPVYLRQEIEEQEIGSYQERNDLYTYFGSTRGLEV